MGTVVLCHKRLRKQGKPDVRIDVSWLKGEKHNQDSGADLVPKPSSSQNKHGDGPPITRHAPRACPQAASSPGPRAPGASTPILLPTEQPRACLPTHTRPPASRPVPASGTLTPGTQVLPRCRKHADPSPATRQPVKHATLGTRRDSHRNQHSTRLPAAAQRGRRVGSLAWGPRMSLNSFLMSAPRTGTRTDIKENPG